MKHIAGWFRRNNTIMAQAKDLSRQLQEAWDERDKFEKDFKDWKRSAQIYHSDYEYVKDMLHRVARERDKERKLRLETYEVCHDAMNQIGAERRLRLAAEDARFDRYMVGDKTLAEAANELRDEYLESVQICTCDHSTFAGFHDEDCPQFNEEE